MRYTYENERITVKFPKLKNFLFKNKEKQSIENSNSSNSTNLSRGNENPVSSNIFATLPNYYQASKMNVEQESLPDILPTYFKLFNKVQTNLVNNV